MNVTISALFGWRIRPVTVTNVASNIFAHSLVAPVVPYVVNNRGMIAFVLHNESGEDWFVGPDNTVTISGATRGRRVPAGGEVGLQIGGDVLNNGVWVISSVAGPADGLVEEYA